jgi:hypothetical protein
MTKRNSATLVTLGVWCALSGTAAAQPTAPPTVPPCTRPPIQCPAPTSTSFFVQINLEPDSDAVCRFNPRNIDALKIKVGEDVSWSFCNACNTDMDVQMDTTGTGPFDKFRIFRPMPSADNLVPIPIRCRDWASAYGMQAQQSGDWKYSLRAKPAGTLTFPDIIDPRLEIDISTFVPPGPVNRWGERALLIVAGLMAGFFAARLLRSTARR